MNETDNVKLKYREATRARSFRESIISSARPAIATPFTTALLAHFRMQLRLEERVAK